MFLKDKNVAMSTSFTLYLLMLAQFEAFEKKLFTIEHIPVFYWSVYCNILWITWLLNLWTFKMLPNVLTTIVDLFTPFSVSESNKSSARIIYYIEYLTFLDSYLAFFFVTSKIIKIN